VLDDVTSPGIAAGDPASDFTNEPQPNGARINMGAYGNTQYASKVAGIMWLLYGDATFDWTVDVVDLIFVRNRLGKDINTGDNRRADVNEDGVLDILDLVYVRNRLGTDCNE